MDKLNSVLSRIEKRIKIVGSFEDPQIEHFFLEGQRTSIEFYYLTTDGRIRKHDGTDPIRKKIIGGTYVVLWRDYGIIKIYATKDVDLNSLRLNIQAQESLWDLYKFTEGGKKFKSEATELLDLATKGFINPELVEKILQHHWIGPWDRLHKKASSYTAKAVDEEKLRKKMISEIINFISDEKIFSFYTEEEKGRMIILPMGQNPNNLISGFSNYCCLREIGIESFKNLEQYGSLPHWGVLSILKWAEKISSPRLVDVLKHIREEIKKTVVCLFLNRQTKERREAFCYIEKRKGYGGNDFYTHRM